MVTTGLSRVIQTSLVMLCAAWVVPATQATEQLLNITVVDQKNNPLSNAVIQLHNEQASIQDQPAPPIIDIVQHYQEFAPQVSMVPVGSKVRFPNLDDILHHVYSFSEAKTFDIPLYGGSVPDAIELSEPGVVTLGCNIHDWMKAYIVVVDTHYYGKSNESGQLSMSPETGEYRLDLWHPRQRKPYSQQIHITEERQELSIRIKVKPEMRSRRTQSTDYDDYEP